MARFSHFSLSVKPETIEIVANNREAFNSGQEVALYCRSQGSRPVAQLTWYKNGVQLFTGIEYALSWIVDSLTNLSLSLSLIHRQRYEQSKNLSTSLLKFVAKDTDHNSEIECEASNIRLRNTTNKIRDRLVIQVNCKAFWKIKTKLTNICSKDLPKVLLKMDKSDDAVDDQVENSTLHMHCSAAAFPPASSVLWYLNATTLLDANKAGKMSIMLNGSTLTIANLDHTIHDGHYTCLVSNSQGGTMSNKVRVAVACKFESTCYQTISCQMFLPRCSKMLEHSIHLRREHQRDRGHRMSSGGASLDRQLPVAHESKHEHSCQA